MSEGRERRTNPSQQVETVDDGRGEVRANSSGSAAVSPFGEKFQCSPNNERIVVEMRGTWDETDTEGGGGVRKHQKGGSLSPGTAKTSNAWAILGVMLYISLGTTLPSLASMEDEGNRSNTRFIRALAGDMER